MSTRLPDGDAARQRGGRIARVTGTVLTLCGVVVIGVGAGPAGAGVSVGSDGSRVAVTGYRAGGEDHPTVQASSPGGSVSCRELIAETNGLVDGDGAGSGVQWPPLDPTRTPRWRYWLDCRYTSGPLAGTSVPLGNGGLGFVYAEEIIDFDAVVRTAAQQYAGQTIGPALSIGTSPPRGLVGVEQWFWVEGYDGGSIEQVHDVLGRRVEVQLSLAEVRWRFGPDRVLVLAAPGLGRTGERSEVTHRFQQRSTTAADPGRGHPVEVTVTLAVRYLLDGAGPFVVDPPITVTVETPVVVREAQAVVHR